MESLEPMFWVRLFTILIGVSWTMPLFFLQYLLLIPTTLYQSLSCWQEDRRAGAPGERFDVGGYALHLYAQGDAQPGLPTVVLDHSLGGIEGYVLIDELAKLTRVCICDRAGYGWSDPSPKPRTSDVIIQEIEAVLTQAGIEPPYLLVGDSFGSYNLRLYAHRFPEKVSGLILTDGLHESGMMQMPLQLKLLKLLFNAGFVMSVLGSATGIVRILERLGLFELVKPELRQCHRQGLRRIKRSLLRPRHWWTMSREIWSLYDSGKQLQVASDLGDLPMINIKAKSFFWDSPLNVILPMKAADRLRDRMHEQLMTLSTNCQQLRAEDSSHFVWVDQPDVMIEAVKMLLQTE